MSHQRHTYSHGFEVCDNIFHGSLSFAFRLVNHLLPLPLLSEKNGCFPLILLFIVFLKSINVTLVLQELACKSFKNKITVAVHLHVECTLIS